MFNHSGMTSVDITSQSDFLRSIEIVKQASSTLHQTVGNKMNKFVSGLAHAATNEKETAEKVATLDFCV